MAHESAALTRVRIPELISLAAAQDASEVGKRDFRDTIIHRLHLAKAVLRTAVPSRPVKEHHFIACLPVESGPGWFAASVEHNFATSTAVQRIAMLGFNG
jgi:hypothetical protein